MNIKMIAADLDNTLLRTGPILSPYTVSVLQKCRDAGIITAYATARSKRAAQRFIDAFTPDIFIGYGGALAMAGDEVISRFAIDGDTAHRLIAQSTSTPGINAVLAINESQALTNSLAALAMSDSSHYKYYDFSQKSGMSFLKITLEAEDPEAVEAIAREFPELDMLRYSGENLYRFAHIKAVKWNALEAAAKYLGISTEDIAAFGDDTIDIEMLKNCGVGVAVENALETVKAAANQICPSNDSDGVARWLEENLLLAQK